MSKRIKTSISLPEELLKKLDKRAEEHKMDRSHFIEYLLETVIELWPTANEMILWALENLSTRQKEKSEDEPG